MVFTDPLVWRCHICGERRLDQFISVRTNRYTIAKDEDYNTPPVEYTEDIRYCNDRPDCMEASKTYKFVRPK